MVEIIVETCVLVWNKVFTWVEVTFLVLGWPQQL